MKGIYLDDKLEYQNGLLLRKLKNGKTVSVGRFSGGNGVRHLRFVFKNSDMPVHRKIWEMFNGTIPLGFIIDHIDGNPINNKIENLRMVTQMGNLQNKNNKIRCDNTSGKTGVWYKKDKKRWYSSIQHNNKVINLGSFETKDGAIKARLEAEKLYKL